MKKLKMNKGQKEKLELIQLYLLTEFGKQGLFVDGPHTYLFRIKKLFINAVGSRIHAKGFLTSGKGAVDHLYDATQITGIYQDGLRTDPDFKNFVEANK